MDNGPVILVLLVLGVTAAEIWTGGALWAAWMQWPVWAIALSTVAALVLFTALAGVLLGLLFLAVFVAVFWGAGRVVVVHTGAIESIVAADGVGMRIPAEPIRGKDGV